MSSDREIADAAVAAYKLKYPNDTNVHAVEVVQNAFRGHLVVLSATEHGQQQRRGGVSTTQANEDEEGHTSEEIAYVNLDLTPKFFTTTAELANFLQRKASSPFIQIMSDTKLIAASTLLLLLCAVFVIGFFGKDRYDPIAFQALSGVLLTAAGFFFGTRQSQ